MSNPTLSLVPLAIPDMSQLSVPVDNIPPVERIRLFSDEQFESFITEWAVSCINTQHFFNSLFNEGERHKVFNLALFESCKGFDFENLFSALLIQATEQLVSESFATAI